MPTIGFIGLGIMGKPMARNLMNKGGYRLVVHNRSQGAVEELVAEGAASAASPREVAERCELIITMLPNSPHVRQVVLGPDGIVEGARPGTLVIDMSSIDPTVAREIGAALGQKSIRFMDAPVSGGEPKAIEGTLSIMAGGAAEDFEEALPVLKCMGASAVRVGDVGAGNVAKLANQVIVALNIAAMGEALTLAVKAGVDPQLVYQAIRGGLAGSTVLDAKAPLVMARKFNPGFRINLHIKDLANALAASHEVGAPLPLTAQMMEIMQALAVEGMGDLDHGAIVRYFEKLAQVEVKQQER